MTDPTAARVRPPLLAAVAALVALGSALFAIALTTISQARPAPPLTTILAAPESPSSSRRATFTYTNIEPVGGFECRLDGGLFLPCGTARPSTVSFGGLAEGEHVFEVRAVSGGRIGVPARHGWTIDLSVAAGGSGAGGAPVAAPGTSRPQGFTISGDVPASQPLFPGGPARVIPLRLDNPNTVAIHVTSLIVSIDTARLPDGCRGEWFEVQQSSVSAAERLTVPAKGSVTLPLARASAPTLRMLDSGDQDACQGASLRLIYSGTAGS